MLVPPSLELGDLFLLFSDGVTEARGADGRMYGQQRLVEFLARQREATLEDSLSALLADLEAWCGGPAGDDVSVLAAEFVPVSQPGTNAACRLATL